jgi:hypothetical protein
MHLLFVFVSLIDKTNLNEQTQANIFASNSRDVARLVVIERIWLRGAFHIISMSVSILARFNEAKMIPLICLGIPRTMSHSFSNERAGRQPTARKQHSF